MIWRRMMFCAAAGALFGTYLALAHLPVDMPSQQYWISMLWSLSLVGAGGAVLGFASAAVGRIGGPWFSDRWRAGVEAVILTGAACWLALNETLCWLTDEVLGLDAMRLVRHNPKAVLEASWEMAGKYVIATLLAAVIVGLGLYWALRRERAAAQVENKSRGKMIGRIARGTFAVMVVVVFGLFALQFVGTASPALANLSRCAPPLRALNLPRALIGDELQIPYVPARGKTIISDEAFGATVGAPVEKRNVILIILESVPARGLGCYGYERKEVSPNIDVLAENGVVFDHCISAASFSSYGLVSLMTSLHLLRAETNDHFANIDFPHFGIHKLMKYAGYDLALFSSGNETFENINTFYPPRDFDTYFSHDTSDIPKTDSMRMDDRHAVSRFETWMEDRQDGRPFFCMFNLQSTHFNYEVPPPWDTHYKPVPPRYSNGHAIIHLPDELVAPIRNAFDNALRYSDHFVGRIVAALQAKDAFDNSLIVITADHGEGFMEHGLARHGVHLFDEFVHVPMIVAAPGLIAPARRSGTVSTLDIGPTIAGVLGLPPHPSWQGENILAEDEKAADRPIYTVLQLTRWQEAVYFRGMKYIYDLSECRDYLFDLSADPMERRDLTRREPALRNTMRKTLARWHQNQLLYYQGSPGEFSHYLAPVK
jgi:arylsulfatase A-like enzyme